MTSPEHHHSQVAEMLPAYVLGALEPEEMLAVDEHVRASPELQARLRDLEQAAGQLVHVAPHAPLSSAVGERLFARVRADLAAQRAPADAPAARPAQGMRDRFSGGGWRIGDWFASLRRQGFALAGALVVLLVLGVYIGQLEAQLRQTTGQLATVRADMAQIQQQAQNDRRLIALFANPEQRVVLIGSDAAANARGTFYQSANQGVFVVEGLAALPPQQTYQLWFLVNGTPVSAGLLPQASPDGPTVLMIAVPADLQGFAGMAVSVEQAGGSQSPQGPVIMQGDVI